MFKVKDVSKELGISEQAVYKKFRTIEEIQEHISLVDGVRCISEDGLNLLKQDKKFKFKRFSRFNDDRKIEKEEPKEQEQEESLKFKEIIGLKVDSEVIFLREENKRLLDVIKEQNQLLLNSQRLQQQALSNSELILLDKRRELEERKEDFNSKNSWFKSWFKSWLNS